MRLPLAFAGFAATSEAPVTSTEAATEASTVENGCSTHDHCSTADYCNAVNICFGCAFCGFFNDGIGGSSCGDHCNPTTEAQSPVPTVAAVALPACEMPAIMAVAMPIITLNDNCIAPIYALQGGFESPTLTDQLCECLGLADPASFPTNCAGTAGSTESLSVSLLALVDRCPAPAVQVGDLVCGVEATVTVSQLRFEHFPHIPQFRPLPSSPRPVVYLGTR